MGNDVYVRSVHNIKSKSIYLFLHLWETLSTAVAGAWTMKIALSWWLHEVALPGGGVRGSVEAFKRVLDLTC